MKFVMLLFVFSLFSCTEKEEFTNLAHTPAYSEIITQFQQRLIDKLKTVRSNDLDIDYGAK